MSSIHKSSNLFRAIEFATRSHRGQFRKGTRVPYIVHPLGVAHSLIRHDCPEELVMAGVLHDTIEDCGVTVTELRRRFGSEVAAIVKGCTEPRRKAPWQERKQHTVDFLETARPEILTVSVADKLDNARSIVSDFTTFGDVLWTRFNQPRAQQAWYYHGLADVFAKRADATLAPMLAREFVTTVRNFFK